MYLFDRKGNSINVYSLTPDFEALKKYRAEELRKAFAEEELVYKALTNSEPILENKDVLKMSELNYDIDGEYHKLELDKHKSMVEIIHVLGNFLNGEYVSNRIVQVLNENNEVIKYLLIVSNYLIKYYPSFNQKHMHHILNLPRSLYLLQLLQQQKYSELKNENIDSLLSMFKLSEQPVDNFGYTSFINQDKTLEMVNSSQHILQRKLELNSKKN